MKKVLVLTFLFISIINANNITKKQCSTKENMIFIKGECINYFVEEGDREGKLNIIVHGAWKDGTNILARYTPFASSIAMNTDITTITFAMPGYSKSSTNNLKGLLHNKKISRLGKKEYIEFLYAVFNKFKIDYKAKELNIIAHSAGAALSATVSAIHPKLIKNLILAGGRYNLHNYKGQKDLVSVEDYIDNIGTYTNYFIIYGSKDKISKPNISINFYEKLKSLNRNVKILEIKNHGHLDLDMSDQSIEEISTLLE